jgi:predicted secreted protein
MLLSLVIATGTAVTVLGFSPDDSKVALIEHGIGSGSGNAHAVLHILDVRKGTEVGQPVEVNGDNDDEDAAVARARAAAKGDWKATEVAHEDGGRMNDAQGAPVGNLELKTKSAGPREREKCEEPFQPLLVKLTVLWMDDDKPARIADEKKPPAARPCASECAVEKIYAHGKAALVVVKCTVQGFEGPAPKYSYYTAQLAYGLAE